jgi:methylamine dehydrogenase light chain
MLKLLSRLSGLLDSAVEHGARASARRYGRRSVLAKAGGALIGGAFAAALPFDRAFGAPGPAEEEGDEATCEYWRYCALDGFLCSTAGGSATSCPAGSEASVVSWVGTCHNPADGRDYLVSYNDCCGKAYYTGAQFCLSSEGERPGYRMGLHNDINWCMANDNQGYHCTVAVVVGVAE